MRNAQANSESGRLRRKSNPTDDLCPKALSRLTPPSRTGPPPAKVPCQTPRPFWRKPVGRLSLQFGSLRDPATQAFPIQFHTVWGRTNADGPPCGPSPTHAGRGRPAGFGNPQLTFAFAQDITAELRICPLRDAGYGMPTMQWPVQSAKKRGGLMLILAHPLVRLGYPGTHSRALLFPSYRLSDRHDGHQGNA